MTTQEFCEILVESQLYIPSWMNKDDLEKLHHFLEDSERIEVALSAA